MKRRLLSLLLAVVTVLGMLPVTLAAEKDASNIKIDFAEDFASASKQDFWDELRHDGDIRYQGYGSYDDVGSTSAEQKATYEQAYSRLRSWMEENLDWSFVENICLANNTGVMKRMFFNAAEDAQWGLAIQPTFHSWGSDYIKFRLNVDVAAAGAYGMNLTYLQGGGSMQVAVNDSPISGTINTAGTTAQITAPLGVVELKQGKNTVDISVTAGKVSLCGLEFVPYADELELTLDQGEKKSYSLTEDLFLAKGKNYTLSSSDEAIASAAVDAGGNVVLRGLSQGESTVAVKDGEETVYTFRVQVTGQAAEVHIPKTIDIDLIAFAQKAARQSFWEDLGSTNIDGVRSVGGGYYTTISDNQMEAFRQMQAYSLKQEGWYFTDGNPIIGTYYSGRRIFIDSASETFGLRFTADILESPGEDKSKMLFTVVVEEGDAGLYALDFDVFHDDGTVSPVNGLGGGGGHGDVWVNGEKIYEDMFFGAEQGAAVRQTDSFGAVYLKEGENIVGIDLVQANATGGKMLYLAGVTLTPLEQVQMQLNTRKVLDLRGTYLPFDGNVDGCTVTSSNETVVSAALDDHGFLSLQAKGTGLASVLICKADEEVCAIDVLVRAGEDLVYDLSKASSLTKDGFDKIESYDDLAVDDIYSENWKYESGKGHYNGAAIIKNGSLSLTLEVDQDGWFSPEVSYFFHPGGGKATLWLDELCLGTILGYGSKLTTASQTLRPVYLEQGEYTFTVQAENEMKLDQLHFAATEDVSLLLRADEEAVSMKQHRSVQVPLSANWSTGLAENLSGALWQVETSDGIEAKVEDCVLIITGREICADGWVKVTAMVGAAEGSVTIPVTVLAPEALQSMAVTIDCVDEGGIARNSVHDLCYDMVGADGEAILPGEVDITYTCTPEGIIEVKDHAVHALANGTARLDILVRQGDITFTESMELTVGNYGENRLPEDASTFEGENLWNSLPHGGDTFTFNEIADDGTGNHALKVTLNPEVVFAQGGHGDNQHVVDGKFAKIKPGHIYEVTMRVKTENMKFPNNYAFGLMVYIQALDYAENSAGSAMMNDFYTTYVADNKEFEEWTQITLPVHVPLSGDKPLYIKPSITIRPYLPADQALSGWEGTFWFDDVQVRETGFAGAEFEFRQQPETIYKPVDVLVKPVTTAGSVLAIDAQQVSLGTVTSSNEDVLRVGGKSLYRYATDTDIQLWSVEPMGLNGTTTLTAQFPIGSRIYTGTTDVTIGVMPDQLKQLTLKLDGFESHVLKRGETAASTMEGLTTQLREVSDEEIRSMGQVYFASEDPSVATVDAKTGKVTCVGEGSTQITAYAMMNGHAVKGSAVITVQDDTDLVSMQIVASADYVAVGAQMQMKTEGTRASGGRADLDHGTVFWSVDDETVATISQDGKLIGLKEGTVIVTATVGVMRKAVVATKQIKVVSDTTLPDEAIVLDFVDGRAKFVPDATVEKDGYSMVWDECVNKGADLIYELSGVSQNTPVGKSMVLEFAVRRSGWYWLEVRGQIANANGARADVFVDDTYMGKADFGKGAGTLYDICGKLNTVWLDAGVHRVELTADKAGMIYLGMLNFYPAKDPNPTELYASIADAELLAGQSTQVSVSVCSANGQKQSLLVQDSAPDFVNYYTLTSSDPKVIRTEKDRCIAVGAGQAQVTVTMNWQGETTTEVFTVIVTDGVIASCDLTAEKTTLKPGAEPVQLVFTAYDMAGNAVETDLPVTYRSENIAVAQVSETGLVTVGQTEGSAKIIASVTENGRTEEAVCWITVTKGKTEPSLYTNEERAIARENVLKYDWAWQAKEKAVQKADYYIQHVDQIYDMWIREGTVPRSVRVGNRWTNGDAYRFCRYCGVDIVGTYGHYPWIVDPIENPWKVTCPACKRSFPSNDFESYYKSGLDETGRFRKQLADPQFLVNELYPEMGEGWGVDAGTGYDSGAPHYTGGTANDNHTYLAYYMHCVLCTIGNSQHSMPVILDALREAYIYTGDEKYGNAGAILVDRIADIYPEYYRKNWGSDYAVSDGDGIAGRFVGCGWDAEVLAVSMAQAADAFWPCMENDEVVEYLRGRAAWKQMDPEDITPEYIRENVDNGLLLEIKKGCETGDIRGNFGMEQAAMAYAAVALDRMPETQEMIDWVFRTGGRTGTAGNYTNPGGSIMQGLIDRVNHDGFGDEISWQYLELWTKNLTDLAMALDGYDKVEGADLWKNQKFVYMQSSTARIVVVGRNMANLGEAGHFQMGDYTPALLKDLTTAYTKTRDRDIARILYAVNGNSVTGLHGDIFTRDPESGIRSEIQKIVNEDGPWNWSQSDMMSGYGVALLREGPATHIREVNSHEFSDYYMFFGKTGGPGHGRWDALNLDLDAFGLNLSSTMGYPLVVSGSDPERQQWVRNTVSHNTVVVDDDTQSELFYGAFPKHFDDSGKVKLMDVNASNAYGQTDIYRRTVVTVDNGDGVHYAVDFFRVLGGKEHVYSFHAASNTDPVTTGLTMTEQPFGTYAGAEVPFGPYGDVANATYDRGGGYSWLDGVSRDADPEASFTVDWSVKDFRSTLSTTSGIHLKMHMLSEEPASEVALANGHPPKAYDNPEHVEYMLVRRSSEQKLDSLFTAVIEPYQFNSYVAKSELVDAVLTDGAEQPGDRVGAVKVTLVCGREDYIIYATNPNCIYEIDGKFAFRGFVGVVSYEGGAVTYAYGNEATCVADVIGDARAAVTGTVVDFTKDLSLEGYTMTVQLDQPIAPQDLTEKYIYVNNDGERNGVYRIYGAKAAGDQMILDLGGQTLIRALADAMDLSQGYVYNIAEGQSFTIPLPCDFSTADVLIHTADQVVKAGNKLSLTTGISGMGVTYEIEGLPTAAKLDGKNGTITWATSRTQTGRYPVTVKAVDADGETKATMEFTIYVVNYTGSAYDADKCSHAKAVTFGTDVVCPACGTITKTGADSEGTEKFSFVGSNMTLGNELDQNFMVATTDLKDGYKALITHNGETVEATFGRYNSTYSRVSFSVAAKEMADPIEVVVVDENGREVSEVYTSSVRDYAAKALAASTSSAKVKTLVVDMLNYGAAAQTYFGYNTEDLANAKLTDAQKALATGDVSCTDRRVQGKNYYGSNLSLEDKILLNLYFKNCTADMTAKVTFKDHKGKTVTADAALKKYSGKIYKVEVDEVVLADAFCDVMVTVYDGEAVFASATDSVESYVARSERSDLYLSIIKFAASAKAYLS